MELNVVCSPKFFYPGDLLIDVFSAITLFIIAYYSYKLLCHHKQAGITCDQRHVKFLSEGLFIFGISFIIKLALDAYIILFDMAEDAAAAQHIFISPTALAGALIVGGYVVYKLLTFISLVLIYSVAFKQDSSLSKLLVFSLLVLSLLFFEGPTSYVFFLASCIVLFIIAMRYYQQYVETKNALTARISLSFGLLSFSYFMFMFAELNPLVYVITKLIWLGSFVLLFVSFTKLMYYGKKKK